MLGLEQSAWALDKQGSAHGGQVGGDAKEFRLALFRYALHFGIDLLGRRLSIPIDVNVLTDRERKKALVFAPSELNLIGGLTSTNGLTKGFDLELGARVEHDRPVDRGNFTQTYVDARARLLFSGAALSPGLGHSLLDGDVSGYATVGWFAVNPTYGARPDNSGLALFRYVAHTELSLWQRHLALGAEAVCADRVSKLARAAMGGVDEHDLAGDLVFDGACDELESQLRLRLEHEVGGDLGLLASGGVFRPGLGHVEREVDGHVLPSRGDRQTDADLAVADLAESARILALHTDRVLALLGEPGVIGDPRSHGLLLLERFHRMPRGLPMERQSKKQTTWAYTPAPRGCHSRVNPSQ